MKILALLVLMAASSTAWSAPTMLNSVQLDSVHAGTAVSDARLYAAQLRAYAAELKTWARNSVGPRPVRPARP